MTPEGKVLAACIRLLEKLREAGEPINWFKVAGGPRQQTGQPDLLICYRGRFVAAELKAPGGVATKMQMHRLGQWSKAGAVADVCESADDLRGLLDQAKKAFDVTRPA